MADFRPFCVKCSVRMHCIQNEVYLVRQNDYVQSADLYQCPNCNTQVLSGYGQPILALGKDREYVQRFSHRSKKDGVFFELTVD